MDASRFVIVPLALAALFGPASSSAQDAAAPPDTVAELAAGSGYTCVRWTSGRVSCWGWIDPPAVAGMSAPATTMIGLSADIGGVTDAVELAGGESHACVRRRDDTVACWGTNSQGELGNGTTVTSSVAVAVVGLSDVVQVSAGSGVSCAVVRSGLAYCWGDDSQGALGNGDATRTDISHPVAVAGITDAVEIAVGARNVCVRRQHGNVTCWGGTLGGFGDGVSSTTRSAPGADVADLPLAEHIDASESHSCAVASGSVLCWGGNLGEPADGHHPERRWARTARAVPGLSNIAQVVTGAYSSCALASSGTVSCWGDGRNGLLGDGRTRPSARPRRVTSVRGATSITMGRAHACALLRDGSVTCWGTFHDPADAAFTDSRPHVVIAAP
jgi:alpha-tubulin suppressor-like RCC1 family protein